MKKTQTQLYFRRCNDVILRPFIESDVQTMFVWMNDPETTHFLGRFAPVSFASEKEWFERVSKQSETDCTLAIVDAKSKKLIGCIGAHQIDYRNGTATTGTVIGDKTYWGKGYGTQAKMLLLEYLFYQLNLRKVYSRVIAFKSRSLAYAKKCGYVVEARLPQHHYRDGSYHDEVILAVYRMPWEKLWKKFTQKHV